MSNYTNSSNSSLSSAVVQSFITIFFGFFGVHKFIYHNKKMGLLYLFTFGLFGLGWIYDSILSVINCIKISISHSKYYSSHGSSIDSTYPSDSVLDLNQPYDSMDGHTFEYFCANILRGNGYENVEVTKGSGDQGIDIIAFKDGIKYGIQCKCYSSDIGNKAIQEAYAGKTFYNCHIAVVLTNRYFTKSAKELSKSNKVLLWDRNKLEELIQSQAY